jgi:chromosome segregation ATPase
MTGERGTAGVAAARRALGVMSLLVTGFLLASVASGQPARPATTLDDLVAEVRALRTEIQQLATASMQTQRLATSLSLQEQRIERLGDRVVEAQQAVRVGEADTRARSTHLAQLEEMLRGGSAPPGQRAELDAMVARLQDELARSQRDEQALRAREQELRSALSTEESRWIDLSNRLDEIGRGRDARVEGGR